MRHINIIMYHYIRDLKCSRYPNIKGLDIILFKRQLEFLLQNYKIIRMDDLLEAFVGGCLPENAILLTFDDGYIDNFTYVFPLLAESNIQGSFFPVSSVLDSSVLLDVNKIHLTLATGNEADLYDSFIKEIDYHRGIEFDIPKTNDLIMEYAIPNRFDSGEIIFFKRMLQTVLPERLRKILINKLFIQFVGVNETIIAKELYCDYKQLSLMKKSGMYIGLHGHEHIWLGNKTKDEYENDIDQAINFMDCVKLIDKNAWVMNYPYGSWNNGVVDYVKNHGCLAGLTTKAASADLTKNNKFTLPRLDTNDFPPISVNYINM